MTTKQAQTSRRRVLRGKITKTSKAPSSNTGRRAVDKDRRRVNGTSIYRIFLPGDRFDVFRGDRTSCLVLRSRDGVLYFEDTSVPGEHETTINLGSKWATLTKRGPSITAAELVDQGFGELRPQRLPDDFDRLPQCRDRCTEDLKAICWKIGTKMGVHLADMAERVEDYAEVRGPEHIQDLIDFFRFTFSAYLPKREETSDRTDTAAEANRPGSNAASVENGPSTLTVSHAANNSSPGHSGLTEEENYGGPIIGTSVAQLPSETVFRIGTRFFNAKHITSVTGYKLERTLSIEAWDRGIALTDWRTPDSTNDILKADGQSITAGEMVAIGHGELLALYY